MKFEVLFLIKCVLFDAGAAKKFINAIKSDVLVISHKSILPKRHQEVETETIFSLKFPGTSNEFHLKLDRVNKKSEYFRTLLP